jgi:hypothetical protein
MIRLASSLPVGSPERVEILRVVVAAKAEGEDVEALLKKHGLNSQDLLDVMTFVLGSASLNQPPEVVTANFKSWWGGAFPSQWKALTKAEMAKVIQKVVDSVPSAIALSARLQGKGGEPPKGKKAATRKTASAVMLIAAAVTVAHKNQKDEEDHRQKRMKQEAKKDKDYKPDYSEKRPVTFFSQKENKTVEFTGDENARWRFTRNQEYDDYVWASEKAGMEPIEKDDWSAANNPPKIWWGETPKDTVVKQQEAYASTALLARIVRDAINKNGEDADIKKIVRGEIKKRADNSAEQWQESRDRVVNTEIKSYMQNRFADILSSEKDSAGMFEKMVGLVAPKWAEAKAEGRAKERAEAEKGTHTYEQYVEKKRGQGGQPITKEEWESRYGK